MNARGLGLRWDPEDPIQSSRKLGAKHGLAGVPDSALPDIEIQSDRDDIRNQGRTESCTGHGITDAGRTACIVQGLPDPGVLGAAHNYATARLKGGDAKYHVDGEGWKFFDDAGAFPSALMHGAESYGFVTEENYPFDPSRINDVPTFDELQAGRGYRLALGAWERISGVTALRRAIHAKCGITISMSVTESFADLDGGFCDAMTGEVRGGHMMAIRGRVATVVRGVKRYGFLVANSWGTSWGDSGFVILSDELIASPSCLALIAMKVAPIRSAA